MLRRIQTPPAEVFQLDDLKVDWAKHTVSLKGKPTALTPKEFDLLKALIEAQGRVLTRDVFGKLVLQP